MLGISFSLTRAQVRDLDRRAVEEYGLPGIVLMENAGRGAAELLRQLAPDQKRFLILCGPGNNGGDGFVMARHMQNHGVEADVLFFGSLRSLPDDASVNAAVWQKTGSLRIARAGMPLDAESRQIIEKSSGWIVDSLFGTGLTRPLGPPFDEVVTAVNASGRPVLAVDIPSGLDCDTGLPLGPTIRAAHTATFVAPKRGFLADEAAEYVGAVHVIDIGAPKKLADEYRLARS